MDHRESTKGTKQLLEKGDNQYVDHHDVDEEDPSDIFDTSLSTLFSIPPIAFSTSSSDALLTYNPPRSTQDTSYREKAGESASKGTIVKDGQSLRSSVLPIPIDLKIPTPSAEVWTKLQANHLWLSAIYLADLLSIGEIPINPGSRLAELGAGAGLPGIVAFTKGAKVVSTDWRDQSILDTLKHNFTLAEQKHHQSTPNSDIIPPGLVSSKTSAKWSVIAHEWGTDTSQLRSPPGFNGTNEGNLFDMILLADTLWVTEAQTALLDSICCLLAPHGVVHIVAGLHTGRGPVERFMKAATGRGMIAEMIRNVRWIGESPENRWEDISGKGSGAGLEEERGVVVYLTLRRDGASQNQT